MSRYGKIILTLAVIVCVVVLAGQLISRTGREVTRFSDGLDFEGFAEGIGSAISDLGDAFDEGPGEDEYGELRMKYTFPDEIYPYLSMLTEDEQKAYYFIYDGVYNAQKTIKLGKYVGVGKDNVMKVVTAVYNDHPELFWFDSGATYVYEETSGLVVKLDPQYNALVNNLPAAKSSFNANADEIISYARQLSGKGVIAQEVYVHDCLCEICEYDLNADNHQSAYSCLVDGRSVCSGYAKAFQYIMQRLGIPVYFVTGVTSKGGAHAWNIVMINGEAYYMDVTWDDEVGRQISKPVHAFFNVTESDVSKTHTRQGMSVFLPQCTRGDLAYSVAVGDTVRIEQIKWAP